MNGRVASRGGAHPGVSLVCLTVAGALLACGSVGSGPSLPGGGPTADTLQLPGFEPTQEGDLAPGVGGGSAGGYKGLLFSGLVRLTPQMTIAPDLAEAWVVSPTQDVFTFTLRSGVAFADGRPITADDVIFSWERATGPDGDPAIAMTYLDDIVGAAERAAGETERISGLQAVDARTLRVTLVGPRPFFLGKLTYPTAFVLDRDNVAQGPAWWRTPNASGPYRIARWRPDDEIVFERNPHYHTPAGIAQVRYLTTRGGSDLSRYQAGEFDILEVYGQEALQIRDPEHPLHEQLVTQPSLCTTYLQLNINQAPLDDLNLRRALALSVDRETLVARLSDGASLPAVSLLPPAMPGYGRTVSGFDPDAARSALQQAAVQPGAAPLVFTTGGTGPWPGEQTDLLVQDWREGLGLTMTSEVLEWTGFETTVRERPTHLIAGGWCADFPDPSNFFDSLFYSGATYNYGRYTNPALDALLDAARLEPDPTRRIALYQEAEQLLIDDVAFIPLAHSVSDTLVSPRVGGYVAVPIGVALIPTLTLND